MRATNWNLCLSLVATARTSRQVVRAVVLAQDVVEQSGFPCAQESGDDRDRNRFGWHGLDPVALILRAAFMASSFI